MFLGVVGWNKEIAVACEIAAERTLQRIECYDSFEDHGGGLFKGTRLAAKPFQSTPPSLHSRAEVFRGWPDLSELQHPLSFVCLSRDFFEPLQAARIAWLDECVLVGRHETLRTFAKRTKVRYQVLANWDEWITVRITSPD